MPSWLHLQSVSKIITSSSRCTNLLAGEISKQFPTSISPKPIIIATYVAAIYAGQLGYCVLIVLARKAETKVRDSAERKRFIELLKFLPADYHERRRLFFGYCELGYGPLGNSLGKHHYVHLIEALTNSFKVFQWFLVSTVLQGILLLTLLYSNIVLLIYHQPSSARPFDTILIHAPLRFFLVLQFGLMFPLSLL